MNVKYLIFTFTLFSGIIFLAKIKYIETRDVTFAEEDSMNLDEYLKYILTIELIPKSTLETIKILRFLTPFEIIKLARMVYDGQLSPKILTSVGAIKSLSSSQFQQIESRINISSLSKKVIYHLNYLTFLTGDEKSKLFGLKEKNYFKNLNSNLPKKNKRQITNILNEHLIDLVKLFYFIDTDKVEIIIILRDIDVLPNSILDEINLIKSMNLEEFIRVISKIEPFPKTVTETLLKIKNYEKEQIELIFLFLNMNPTELNLLYSLALLQLLTPAQINVILFQYKLDAGIKNILDLAKLLKSLNDSAVQDMKKYVSTEVLPVSLLNALEYLNTITITDLSKIIMKSDLDQKLGKYLKPFFSYRILNIVNILKIFDTDKLLKLKQVVSEGRIPNRILLTANVIKSLDQTQFNQIINQKNFKQVSLNVLESLDFLRSINDEQLYLLTNIGFDQNKTTQKLNPISKTKVNTNRYLYLKNGCYISKIVTTVVTETIYQLPGSTCVRKY